MSKARVLFLQIIPAVVAITSVAGCAKVDAQRDYQRAGAEVDGAIGQTPLADPEGEAIAESTTVALLADGLTADEAVKLALLNNPRARAVLLQVGMARADVVQAGLWTNPTVGLSFRLPDGGGLTNIEAGLAQNIADLWMLPSRKLAAERNLNRMTLTAAQELVSLAIDTRVAYYNALSADLAYEIALDNVALTEELLEITSARLEAGTVGSLDVNLAKGQALQADVESRTARLKSASARRTLANLLGLTTSAEALQLTDPLPQPLASELPVERYVETALASRLDARAAYDAMEAAAAGVEFELAKVFQNVEVGFALERNERRAQPSRKILADTARSSIAAGQLTAPSIESRGQRRLEKSQEIEAILGPTLALTLPIFDQNQAQIAKARMTYLQAKATREGIDRSIVQETRDAADRLATAWRVVTLYRQEVMPQAEETLELSRATYQAGQTTILNVIDAQRLLLETRRANVAALQNAATALAELERATAQPVSALFEQPATTRRPVDVQMSEGD